MRFNLRAKLFSILGIAAFALVALIGVSSVFANRIQQQQLLLEKKYIPKLELKPKLEACFERLRRSLQEAVSAHDHDALAATREREQRCLENLSRADGILSPGDVADLRFAIEDYYSTAYDVSSRLLTEEAGEQLLEEIAVMQAKQAQTAALLERATAFEPGELTRAFAVSRAAQESETRVRYIVSAACLLLGLFFCLLVVRGVLRSMTELASGFERFGKSEFDVPIRVESQDEFGDLAGQANAMAQGLKRLSEERDRSDWIKAGHAGLVQELAGDLDPETMADHAVRYLARYLSAVAAALYWQGPDDTFRRLGDYAGKGEGEADPQRVDFRPGEGLLGQCALERELTIITDLPQDYCRVRSGLGQATPNTLVLLPLVYLERVVGVLELAVFKPWSEACSELLLSVGKTLPISLEVARSRAALRELLLETQEQAKRLSAQEDELLASNEELQAQQEELREANQGLIQQAQELERQRQSLESSNVELRQAREALEKRAKELATVSGYKSQFLTNMSHELRTPLNSMLLLSSLLADNDAKNLTDKQVEFCRTINEAGKDLLALINQVLDLAKVESGKQEILPGTVSLLDLAAYAARMYESVAREKKLDFVVEVVPGLPETIITDGRRVEQILNNLVGNAIKFTEQGSVTLRIGKPAPTARLALNQPLDRLIAISVTDTGIGIAPADQLRIFAPFEQLEASPDRRYGGTGLGLAIARQLASLLGGELQVQSVQGQGSCFTCYLPLELPPNASGLGPSATPGLGPRGGAASLAPDSEGGASSPSPSQGTRDPYLLVIEDDPVFADVMAQVITAQGLQYRLAPDGPTGLRMARESRPGGIILDVKLSGADGWSVMESLQGDPSTRSIPVHFVSALEGAERGMAMGAIGYLTKPAARSDLVRVVELLGAAAHESPILVVEDSLEPTKSVFERLKAEGIWARRATSASQAVEWLAQERFSCMVLDLGLPDLDGLEFLQSLQELRGAETPPVLVYSARAMSKSELQRLEAYAESVVLKEGPALERLLAEIRLFAQRFKDRLPTRRSLAPTTSSPNLDLKGRRILVVDDDMRTAYALSALLCAKGGEVFVADTGRAALSTLDEHPEVELVLMDIMMPEMDGYEAMRRMREDPRYASLPIVALTAKAMKTDRSKCIEAGANDYLAKPIDADRLFALLQVHFSKAVSDAAGE